MTSGRAILLLLEEEPRNGYGLMQEVEERSGGAWRPEPRLGPPGALPARGRRSGRDGRTEGRKDFPTGAGREWVEEHREEIGSPLGYRRPWTPGNRFPEEVDLALAMAARQLAHTGTPAQPRGSAKARR